MTASEDGHTSRISRSPLLDPAVLKDLAEDVGPQAATAFAREFAAMWSRRRDALSRALARDDPAEAMDAVLSLRVSSAMVGARRLEELAARLESDLRTKGLASATPFVEGIEQCGEETARALMTCQPPA